MPQSFEHASIVKNDAIQRQLKTKIDFDNVANFQGQKTNFSRLRQRFQQVASKAMPIPQSISSKINNGNNNWAQFTNSVRRTLEEAKDDNIINFMQALVPQDNQLEQLVEINLDDSDHNDLQRKTESEPDLTRICDDPLEDLATLKADSKLSSLCSLTFPMQMRPDDKPILALDLDETLIHSSVVPRRPADFWIEVIQNGDLRTREVFWVYKRPGVDEFLLKVAQYYTVVIFTAGIKEYAAQILDELDPDHKIFSGRLYRDSCTETRGLHPSMIPTTAPPSAYAKDMNKVCDNMSKVMLVDNTPGCFALQPSNGLPIRSWYGDTGDRQLARLQDFLVGIRQSDDLRVPLMEWRL